MQIFNSIDEIRNFKRECILSKHTLGFVPTMGNLHLGHLRLVLESLKCNDKTIVSIFVNPTQFGEGEDFDKYPRTFDDDCSKLKQLNNDNNYNGIIVFAPSSNVMYPSGKDNELIKVIPEAFADIAEGQSRPDFFNGVSQICTKLFNIVQPDSIYFGQKDISQCILIQRLVVDLCMNIEVHIIETVRESDGLAMSSRNNYLSQEERGLAKILYEALVVGQRMCNDYYSNNNYNNYNGDHSRSVTDSSHNNHHNEIEKGDKHVITAARVKEAVSMVLTRSHSRVKVQYISFAHPKTMVEMPYYDRTTGVVLSAAVMVGSVRLIDNVLVGNAARSAIYSSK